MIGKLRPSPSWQPLTSPVSLWTSRPARRVHGSRRAACSWLTRAASTHQCRAGLSHLAPSRPSPRPSARRGHQGKGGRPAPAPGTPCRPSRPSWDGTSGAGATDRPAGRPGARVGRSMRVLSISRRTRSQEAGSVWRISRSVGPMFASGFFEPCHRTEQPRIRTFSCMRSRNSIRQPKASSSRTSSRCRSAREGSCCSSGERVKTVTRGPAAIFGPIVRAHRRTRDGSMNAEYDSMLCSARSTSHATASRTALCSKKAGRASSSSESVASWSAPLPRAAVKEILARLPRAGEESALGQGAFGVAPPFREDLGVHRRQKFLDGVGMFRPGHVHRSPLCPPADPEALRGSVVTGRAGSGLWPIIGRERPGRDDLRRAGPRSARHEPRPRRPSDTVGESGPRDAFAGGG